MFPHSSFPGDGPRTAGDGQHVYHHSAVDGARVNVKVEKNTKGFNWEVTVQDARSVDEALVLIADAITKIERQLAPPAVVPALPDAVSAGGAA